MISPPKSTYATQDATVIFRAYFRRLFWSDRRECLGKTCVFKLKRKCTLSINCRSRGQPARGFSKFAWDCYEAILSLYKCLIGICGRMYFPVVVFKKRSRNDSIHNYMPLLSINTSNMLPSLYLSTRTENELLFISVRVPHNESLISSA